MPFGHAYIQKGQKKYVTLQTHYKKRKQGKQ